MPTRLSAIAAGWTAPAVVGLVRDGEVLEDRGLEHEVDQIRIELRAPLARDFHGGRFGAARPPVVSAVRDHVEGVGDRRDSREERNPPAGKSPRVSGAVPSLVMRKHAARELGIERRKRCEDVGATPGMGEDCAPLVRAEACPIMDGVDQGLVDLADVMEERDSLDGPHGVRVEVRGIAEDQRVARDSSQVLARFVVSRLDGVQQGLERRGGQTFGGRAANVLDAEEGDGSEKECVPHLMANRARSGHTKSESPWTEGPGAFQEAPATAYSPAVSRPEYHRRCRA